MLNLRTQATAAEYLQHSTSASRPPPSDIELQRTGLQRFHVELAAAARLRVRRRLFDQQIVLERFLQLLGRLSFARETV
jgi:hypothetical protein